jgi:hypothetical protein
MWVTKVKVKQYIFICSQLTLSFTCLTCFRQEGHVFGIASTISP